MQHQMKCAYIREACTHHDVVNVGTTTEVEEVRGGRSRLGNVKEEPNVSTFLFCINLI